VATRGRWPRGCVVQGPVSEGLSTRPASAIPVAAIARPKFGTWARRRRDLLNRSWLRRSSEGKIASKRNRWGDLLGGFGCAPGGEERRE
jgi:hypothetical protein